MRAVSAIEVTLLVKELQRLEGFFIDNFYELGEDRFRLRLSRSGEKVELFALLPYTLNTTEYYEKGEPISNFYIAVRKRIVGARIERIAQLNADRIVEIAFTKSEEKGSIVFELFAKGNLIVLDADKRIVLAYKSKGFKERDVKVGTIYAPPETRGIPPSELDGDALAKLLSSQSGSDDSLIRLLSKNVNIGAIYLEDAIYEAHLNPKAKTESIGAKQAEALAAGIARRAGAISNPDATLYIKDGAPVDYSICAVTKYDNLEKQKKDTLNSALDTFYHEAQFSGEPKTSESAKKTEGIKISIERQRESLAKIEEEASEARKKGEAIFKNMNIVNGIVQALKDNKRMTREELQNMFPTVKIIEIDLKEKTVTIEME